MGNQAKVMHGARAIVKIGGIARGIFTNVSYSVQYDAQPVYGLGRFGPHEIALTGVQPVSVQASGWRIVDTKEKKRGPHIEASIPRLDELLRHEDTTITIEDRQDPDTPILHVSGVRPLGYQTSISARGLQEISCSFMGLAATDETGDQAEVDPVKL